MFEMFKFIFRYSGIFVLIIINSEMDCFSFLKVNWKCF